MEVFIFRTPAGQSVAIPEDDIATVWSAEIKGHMIITRIIESPSIEVVYDFDEFVMGEWAHVDLRPETPEPVETPPPVASEDNVIRVDFSNHGKK